MNALTVIAVVFGYLAFQEFLPPAQLPELVSLLVGAISSIVVQLVKKKVAGTVGRFFLALALAALTGGLSYYVAKPDETNVIIFVVHIFAYSQLAYAAFWKVLWQETLGLRDLGKKL